MSLIRVPHYLTRKEKKDLRQRRRTHSFQSRVSQQAGQESNVRPRSMHVARSYQFGRLVG